MMELVARLMWWLIIRSKSECGHDWLAYYRGSSSIVSEDCPVIPPSEWRDLKFKREARKRILDHLQYPMLNEKKLDDIRIVQISRIRTPYPVKAPSEMLNCRTSSKELQEEGLFDQSLTMGALCSLSRKGRCCLLLQDRSSSGYHQFESERKINRRPRLEPDMGTLSSQSCHLG
ncbi:hypothetical protein Tco_0410581 [Tanacetum coccineum]